MHGVSQLVGGMCPGCPPPKVYAYVHTMIMDQVISSLKHRFSEYGSLYADLCCLDPRNFAEVLPSDGLHQCCPTRGPHAARRLILCGPPVLAKFVRNLCKKSSKRQNLTLAMSRQIKFFKLSKYKLIRFSTHK